MEVIMSGGPEQFTTHLLQAIQNHVNEVGSVQSEGEFHIICTKYDGHIRTLDEKYVPGTSQVWHNYFDVEVHAIKKNMEAWFTVFIKSDHHSWSHEIKRVHTDTLKDEYSLGHQELLSFIGKDRKDNILNVSFYAHEDTSKATIAHSVDQFIVALDVLLLDITDSREGAVNNQPFRPIISTEYDGHIILMIPEVRHNEAIKKGEKIVLRGIKHLLVCSRAPGKVEFHIQQFDDHEANLILECNLIKKWDEPGQSGNYIVRHNSSQVILGFSRVP